MEATSHKHVETKVPINRVAIKERAKRFLQGNWVNVIISIIIVGVLAEVLEYIAATINILSNFMGLFGPIGPIIKMVGIVLGIIMVVVGPILELGLRYIYLRISRGFTVTLSDGFSKINMFAKVFLLDLLITTFIWLWSLLLLIPGIIARYRYSMALNILLDNPDISVWDAIKKSKELTDGRKWELFVLDCSFLGWAFLCTFTFGIGFFFLEPYKGVTWAIFYNNLIGYESGLEEAEEPKGLERPERPKGLEEPKGPKGPEGEVIVDKYLINSENKIVHAHEDIGGGAIKSTMRYTDTEVNAAKWMDKEEGQKFFGQPDDLD